MAKRHGRARSNPVQTFNIHNDNIFELTTDNDFTNEAFVATVDRVSNDGRRVYRQSLTIPAPSPQKLATTQPGNQSSWSIWDDITEDEDLMPGALDGSRRSEFTATECEYDDSASRESFDEDLDRSEGVSESVEKTKKKGARYLSSDEPLKEWMPFQEEYLNELLQHESRRSSASRNGTASATFPLLSRLSVYGSNWVIAQKLLAPTHLPFQTLLSSTSMGYTLSMSISAHANRLPVTVFLISSSCVGHFAMVTLQGKITMYDYYSAMEKLTDNIFTSDLPARYKEITRIFREYRHLISLKRCGRANDAGGILATQNGELAVTCPACPNPDVNLPSNWTQLPKGQQYLYTLFIALDACFRLKRRLVSSVKKDPGLGIGWSYFVEREPFREYLLGVTDQKEMNTCSSLAALDYANTKFSRGYAVTGVCLGVCARHEMIQPNGAVDLQVGERYANMDYCFGSLLRHYDPRLNLLVSYDIACQWGKSAIDRLGRLPPLVRATLRSDKIRFAIPKLHIHSHTKYCQQTYSLNYLPGVGRTDGEGIEQPWANIGATASSTRVMGPGAREETLNQHWGHWNWQKLIGLGYLLAKRLKTAAKERRIQEESFAVFSLKQGTQIKEWAKMVEDFEKDGSKPNPYSVPDQGMTESDVRLRFSQEEKRDVNNGVKPVCDVTPSAFIQEGLEIEGHQRRLRFTTKDMKTSTTHQEVEIQDVRIKLARRLARFRLWQAAYMPSVIPLLTARTVPDEEEIESVPLLLPSELTREEREMCLGNVGSIEREFRDAECQSALNEIRNNLLIKSRLLGYKDRNARHQTANTRTRTLISRNEAKIKQQSAKYQNAWTKLSALVEEGRPMKWKKLNKDDIRCMQDPDSLTHRHARRQRRVENVLGTKLEGQGEAPKDRGNDVGAEHSGATPPRTILKRSLGLNL
ncbi:hypothetical protein ONZ45_g14392 [Pleurotus djamor]|nr:hypothetical protein ONZ45_g14392 [Pleurotus djamor]